MVVTPSLNKSFKFQSNWPDNSSQSYLLESLLNDINNDEKYSLDENGTYYIIKTNVNYPNNEELKYEKIYFDKNKKLKKVEVYSNKDEVKIIVKFNKINLRANLDEDNFLLEDLIDTEECDCQVDNECGSCSIKDEQTSKIEDIIYPLYLPDNTSLTSKDTLNTLEGQRVILTFGGENSFVLVEETSSKENEFEVIPVYGEPEIINDTIGALSNNSISWTSNNIDYYLTGSNISRKELMTIANSINNVTAVNVEK